MLVFALFGCEEPISNASFYADEEFLAVLPDSDRIGFSPIYASVVDITADSDPILAHGFEVAEDLDEVLTHITTLCDILRSSTPDERSGSVRVWEPRPLDGAGDRVWWVRADIVRPSGGADFTWTLEGAASDEGPFATIASGRHDPSDFGVFEWDFGTAGELLGLEGLEGSLSVEYERDEDGVRATEMLYSPVRFGTPVEFALYGEEVFSWTGAFAITNDGETHPGGAAIAITAEHYGRSTGVVVTPQGERRFQSCWNPDNSTVFSTGEGDLFPTTGSPDACGVPDIFDSP